MNTEEAILERLDNLEDRIVPLSDSARALGELREDLAPRVNEAVHALIKELADVEADFQLEDLLFLIKKAMRNVNNLSYSLDQLKNLIDFATTAEPLMKSTVPQMIYYLDDLERNGVFKMLSTILNVMKQIGTTYSAEDLDQIGQGTVRLLGAAKKLTTPEALDFLDSLAEVPARVDVSRAKPVGPFSMFFALGDDQVKAGMGVMLELTKAMACLKPQKASSD